MVNCLSSDREVYFNFRLKMTRLTKKVNSISWNYTITLVFLIH